MAKYDEVSVCIDTSSPNGNAYAILGICTQALLEYGVPEAEIVYYTEEATAGDYENLLAVTEEWLDVDFYAS